MQVIPLSFPLQSVFLPLPIVIMDDDTKFEDGLFCKSYNLKKCDDADVDKALGVQFGPTDWKVRDSLFTQFFENFKLDF
jgi:hypothetical protein